MERPQRAEKVVEKWLPVLAYLTTCERKSPEQNLLVLLVMKCYCPKTGFSAPSPPSISRMNSLLSPPEKKIDLFRGETGIG